MISTSKGRHAAHQLMNENAKCPVVYGTIVAFVQYYLRCYVFWEKRESDIDGYLICNFHAPGVPAKVHVFSPGTRNLANPKSINFK